MKLDVVANSAGDYMFVVKTARALVEIEFGLLLDKLLPKCDAPTRYPIRGSQLPTPSRSHPSGNSWRPCGFGVCGPMPLHVYVHSPLTLT